jgi:zinc and cadmium transporter
VTDWTPTALSALTFVSTFLGGAVALRTRGSLRYFFAFSAGTLLAIALVDLLPEAVTASVDTPAHRAAVFYVVLGSFIAFHLAERYVLVHHLEAPADAGLPAHAGGGLGASGLVMHSVLDGVSIGAAFQVSGGVGVVVATAVIAHDFADGVNTVALVRRVSHSGRRALAFLAADAAAPVAGALATRWVRIPEPWLALGLAFFVGHFLYIAACDLIPEMHRGDRSWRVLAVHLAGVLLIVVLTRLLSG